MARTHHAPAPERLRRPMAVVSPLLIMGTLAVSVIGLAMAIDTTSYDIWGAFWIAPVLLVLSVPIASRASRITGDGRIGRTMMLGALVKVVGGAVLRYGGEQAFYGGGDSDLYHESGRVLGPLFRSGIYTDLGKVSGTRFTEIITGQVYALIGPSQLGGFLVFSWLAFVGLCFFWHAFRIALPDGDHLRYLRLLLFFPTIVFWTSGTGKDAWMMLCLGAATYGLARLLTGRLSGIVVLGLGLWGAAVMRPHLPLIFLVAALVALPTGLLARSREPGALRRRGSTLVLLGVLAVASVGIVGQAEEFFRLDELNVESADAVTSRVETNTQIGGSSFDAPNPESPTGFVASLVTVLFRPFPGEVPNAQGLASSAEGLLLLALVVGSAPRLRRLPSTLLRSPFLLFAVAYTCAFAYAFASIENFGILVRQRAQLLPVLFVLLCFDQSVKRRRAERGGS